jgi:hypothetical protein
MIQGTARLAGSAATDVPGSFAWVDSSTRPTPADSGSTSFPLCFVPSDTTNYESVEASLTVQVAKAAHPASMPPAQMGVPYSTSTLSNELLADWPDWSFDASDLGAALPEGSTTYTARYTAADADCYETTAQDIVLTRSACEHAQTEVVGKKDATCTEAGSTGETRCIACGEVIAPAMDIAPLDHVWRESERVGSNCIRHGSVTYTCKKCGATRTEVLPLDPTAKLANSLSVKAKKAKPSVSLAKLKKRAQTLANIQVVKKGQGTLAYTNASKKAAIKKWKVDKKTGKLTIPKGTKKGTYDVRIKIVAKGDTTHKSATKYVSYKVVVK